VLYFLSFIIISASKIIILCTSTNKYYEEDARNNLRKMSKDVDI